MSSRYAFENLLRTPVELYVAVIGFGIGILCVSWNTLIALDFKSAFFAGMVYFAAATLRLYQGLKVICYQKRMLKLTPFSIKLKSVPLSKEYLFLGKGFRWLPIHRQRLHLLSLPENQYFIQKSWLYRYVSRQAIDNPNGFCALLQQIPLLPFKPQPDIGGKPWLHGIGSDEEQKIYIKQCNRSSHTVVFGMTRVGKTCLMNLLVNQDIQNKEAILVVDPKGDLSVLQNMYISCKAADRLKDFKVLHAGFPEISAKYNPLSSYSNVSEVATRVTNAIEAEGEGKQFKDFAWKFLNTTVACLAEMGEPLTYKSLAFFVTRPRQLLLAYCDKVLPLKDAEYAEKIEKMAKTFGKKVGNTGEKKLTAKGRAEAARLYISKYIDRVVSEGRYGTLHDSNISDLHYAANLGEEYYSKMTASLGPVFDKINKTSAGDIFSWEGNQNSPVIDLENVVKKKQVVYVGLDAMTNQAMSDAVGQAIIADLISLCGRLYKKSPNKKHTLYLHADEFSEIVRDEFVTLLNKAGGAGVKVTAYTQTVNDLGVVFGSHNDKPKMLLGNFGTKIMMRIANHDTAQIFTGCLEEIRSRSSIPSTMRNDRASGGSGDSSSISNTDSVVEEASQIIAENDLFSLPKGQAFLLTNGGEISKIRIPLFEEDKTLPQSFEEIMEIVNFHGKKPAESTLKSKEFQAKESKSMVEEVDYKAAAKSFIDWLREILKKKEKPYRINEEMIFTVFTKYGTNSVFVSDRLFEHYFCASKLSPEITKMALKKNNKSDDRQYVVYKGDEEIPVIRILNIPVPQLELRTFTIKEG